GAEWNGWMSLDDLPHSVNRRDGLEISANSSIARLSRLRQLLSVTQPLDVSALARFQTDSASWNASMLVPLLDRVRSERTDIEAARARLLKWDQNLSVDSADAGVYVAWEQALSRLLVGRRIEPALAEELGLRMKEHLVAVLINPSRVWFD